MFPPRDPCSTGPFPLDEFWASGWPQLECIELLGSFEARKENFVSEFLGIYQAVVDFFKVLAYHASLLTLYVINHHEC